MTTECPPRSSALRRRVGLWTLAACAALSLGVVGGETYARLASPLYAAMVRLIAWGHPWEIVAVDVVPNDLGPGSVLKMMANVRRRPADIMPAAATVARVHVGEVVAGPLVFWTLLLMWPARHVTLRLCRVIVGVAVFALVEGLTTAVQLMHDLPAVSEILEGAPDPFTSSERWSRFLEGGGHFVIDVCGVVVTLWIARYLAGIGQRNSAEISL